MSNEEIEIEDFENNSYVGGRKNTSTSSLKYGKGPFLTYITSFSEKEKNTLLNLVQYGGLSILPLLIVLKLMKLYVPSDDPFKSSTEILIEVVVQIIAILVAFYFIHKLVLYVPTYSKLEYEHISLLAGVLPLFFLMFTLDTKLSEKLNILFDRLLMTIGLKKEPMVEGKDGPKTKMSNSETIINGNPYQQNSVGVIQEPLEQRLNDSNSHVTRDSMVNRGGIEEMQPMMPSEPMPMDSMGGFGSMF